MCDAARPRSGRCVEETDAVRPEPQSRDGGAADRLAVALLGAELLVKVHHGFEVISVQVPGAHPRYAKH
jgi:hypothetical protein